MQKCEIHCMSKSHLVCKSSLCKQCLFSLPNMIFARRLLKHFQFFPFFLFFLSEFSHSGIQRVLPDLTHTHGAYSGCNKGNPFPRFTANQARLLPIKCIPPDISPHHHKKKNRRNTAIKALIQYFSGTPFPISGAWNFPGVSVLLSDIFLNRMVRILLVASLNWEVQKLPIWPCVCLLTSSQLRLASWHIKLGT